MSLLKDEKTIAINTFWKHPIVKDWQPTYYCFGDGLSFRDQKKYDIEYFNSYTQDKIKQYFHDVRANITNSIFFIPYKNGFEKVSKYNYLPPEKTYYIDYLPLPLFELPPSFPDLTKGLPWVQDSSQLAILIAMAMGFSQIVLLGCDHDWFVEIGKEKHFFNEPVTGQGGGTFDSSKYPMIQCMWFAWVLWRGHDALNKLARQHGVEILNATGGGVLDIYPLASYDNFFNNKT